MKIQELSNRHRCFRITGEDGSSECYFFIGVYHEVRGIRKYGICKMVYNPKQDDIANITEEDFLSLLNEGRIELF